MLISHHHRRVPISWACLGFREVTLAVRKTLWNWKNKSCQTQAPAIKLTANAQVKTKAPGVTGAFVRDLGVGGFAVVAVHTAVMSHFVTRSAALPTLWRFSGHIGAVTDAQWAVCHPTGGAVCGGFDSDHHWR